MPHELPSLLADRSLLRRIGVTLAALLAYRTGCWVPLPGVDVTALLAPDPHGGAIARVSVMALGITPLFSALLLLELAMIAAPQVRAWAAKGDNSERLDGWTALAAIAFATFQANGIAGALEEIHGLVPSGGLAFRAGAVVSLVTGTVVVMWLASIITQHGIGNGFWVLLAAPHAASFAEALFVQSSLWGPASLVTIAVSVGFLALSAAAFAMLVKSVPRLAVADEPIWAPVIGFAAATWLLAAALLALWMLAPGQEQDLDAILHGRATLLPLITLPLIALLRRRSLAKAQTLPIFAASAVPLAVVLTAVAALGTFIELYPAQPLFPGTTSVMLLAAVGLSLVEGGVGTAAAVRE